MSEVKDYIVGSTCWCRVEVVEGGKQYRHTLTVTTKNRFPIDMLRYDRCFPTNPDSVSRIEKSLSDSHDYKEYVVTISRLSEKKKDVWCTGRWNSFGVYFV